MTLKRCMALVLLMLPWTPLAVAQRKPHIVVIMAESLGWADVGFHGSRQMRTPQLGRFGGGRCHPEQVLHLALRHGIEDRSSDRGVPFPSRHNENDTSFSTDGTPHTVLYSPDVPEKIGLRHSLRWSQQWSLGFFRDEFTPENRGFDTAFAKWSGPGDYWTHVSSDVLWNKTGMYATRVFTERATEIIAQHDKTKPLFMLVAHQGVQAANGYGSVQCPQEHLESFASIAHRKRVLLAGALAEVDTSVGKVFAALQNRTMLNDTVLVFVSSSGGLPDGDDGGSNWSFNWPLRGTRGTYFEGGVRVPAFVWSPLMADRSPRVSTQLMHVTDWLPTLVHLAGGDAKTLGEVADLDSYNQWPTISKNLASPRKSITHRFDLAGQNFVILLGDYKGFIAKHSSISRERKSAWFPLVGFEPKQSTNFEKRVSSCDAFKALERFYGSGFKLTDPTQRGSLLNCTRMVKPIDCHVGRGPCLFNLAKDPCEQDNIVDKHPAVLMKMKQAIIYGDSYVPWENEKLGDSDADPGLFGGVWVPWRSTPHHRYNQNKNSQECHFDC
ncbi:hypothetical protein MTO96_022648 [Rhipicephalus appendiculatus]